MANTKVLPRAPLLSPSPSCRRRALAVPRERRLPSPLLLACLLLLILCRGAAARTGLLHPDSGPILPNDDGVYKGIPYAAPPVGELRFRPPALPVAWTDPRRFDDFGPACPQSESDEDTSEDCLTLNVWTPAKVSGNRLPVMVFFHGGAFLSGSGSVPVYDGAALSRMGVVVVTLNYRLGALGFLTHPALSSESPQGVSGNYGLLDQQAALSWVSRNITAFGGDPANVTIFGQSAGAASVVLHLFRPEASGLFARAIAQSPVAPGAFRPLRESARGTVAAEAVGQAFARRLGIDPAADDKTTLAALRAADVDAILAASAPDPRLAVEVAGLLFCPTVDGVVVPAHPLELIGRGALPDKPLLIGTTTDEGSLFLPGLMPPAETPWAYSRLVKRRFGPDADKVLALVPGRGEDLRTDLSRLITARWFTAFSVSFAQAMADAGRPVWLYRFAAPAPAGALGMLMDESGASAVTAAQAGVPHSADLFYVFGFAPWYLGFDDADRDLSRRMRTYWTDFAKSGDPNGAGLPAWPRLARDRPQLLFIGQEAAAKPLPVEPLVPLVAASWRTTTY